MSRKATTIADRHRIVDLKLQGTTLSKVATETGLSFECVRFWWRRYRDGGREALNPLDRRRERGGPMSRSPAVIRFAFLRMKKEHPGWGAAVARVRVARRLGLDEDDLPCISTIEKQWAVYGPRLYQLRQKRHPAFPEDSGAKAKNAHERWQMDFKERVPVRNCGRVDVLNIRDEATPVKIASVIFPADTATGRDVQQAMRKAFEQWGLCDRVQTDHDKRLYNTNHVHPFPTYFTLWLVGLDISHDIAPSATVNGCVERYNRTWFERVALGAKPHDMAELQQFTDEARDEMNTILPSKGRQCRGRPPLVRYPEAQQPRRSYLPEQELALFSLDRVHHYLAERFWWRRVTPSGQTSLGGQRFTVGIAHARQDVRITFDADDLQFVVSDADQHEIKRVTPVYLTVEHITGLEAADEQCHDVSRGM